LGRTLLAQNRIVNADLKRQLGIGQGTLTQKALTHCDPFEPDQPKPVEAAPTDDELAAIIATWMRSDD
jgi:hypothetical protein